MLILLRYGCGLPHYRIERLGKNLRMPMPAGTQWGVIAKAADTFEPLWQQLIETAADADLIHIDDTYARVLTLNETIVDEIRAGKDPRTGVFTSGVIARRDGLTMALFFTSRQHAGRTSPRCSRCVPKNVGHRSRWPMRCHAIPRVRSNLH